MLVVLPHPGSPIAYHHPSVVAGLRGVGGLYGLGSTMSGPVLSADQIYLLALNAGFPSDMAVKMTAVALRESTGNPSAYNGNMAGTGDDSYGLWQINLYSPTDPTYKARLMQQIGVTDPNQLFDPATNAQAAYRMWAGSDANFNTAWGYKDYSQWLPEAVLAASDVAGGGEGQGTTLDASTGAGDGSTGLSTTTLATGLVVLAFLVLKG